MEPTNDFFWDETGMGIKPLYYTRTEDAFLFGSEAKALFASGLVSPILDVLSIDNFLSLHTRFSLARCFAV